MAGRIPAAMELRSGIDTRLLSATSGSTFEGVTQVKAAATVEKEPVIIDSHKTGVSREELDARKHSLLAAMAAESIDCVIFTTPHTVLYLTGIALGGFHTGQQALVLSASGEHRFVMRKLEALWHGVWAPQTWATTWVPYRDEQLPSAVIADAVRSVCPSGVTRLGMELDRTWASYATIRRIADSIGAKDLVDSAPLAERLRAIKSETELAHMRKAGVIARKGFDAAAQVIRDGGLDAEAGMAAIAAMYRNGSELICNGPSVPSGPGSVMGHSPWFWRVPQPGDLVPIAMSASVHRYQCPASRGFTKGQPAPRVAAMIETLNTLVEHVLETVRPGMTSHDADRVARDVISKSEFSEFYVNRLAYGIGLGFPPIWWETEIMQLRPNDDRVVKTGMTFHLVPGLQVPGVGQIVRGVPVVVTARGLERLDDLPLRPEPL
jgi:Xaa-Pro dipeptidase